MHKVEMFDELVRAQRPVPGAVYEMPDGSLAVAGKPYVSAARGKALIPIRAAKAVHRGHDDAVITSAP